jgi:hypothetical protein
MTKTITGTYDGRDIHPDEPLPLPRNTRVTLTWRAEEPAKDEDEDIGVSTFLDVALSLNVEGPPDWSARIDHYLYGVDDGKA